MMTPEEFDRWCCSQKLSGSARQEMERIRSFGPSRRVGSGFKNVSGRYPSHKMGATIQFESHKVELPFIYQLEHSEDVLEYYDQPPPFKIQYSSASGRNIGVMITPDFFVISKSQAGWVECKTEKDLEKLAQKSPHRYLRGEDNKWQSPPGLEYAQQFFFDFQFWSSAEINWILQRNLELLQDYYRNDSSLKLHPSYNIITSLVSAQPGISLGELLDFKGVLADDIYSLIAVGEIYVDLTAQILVEADKCLVFADHVFASAYNAIIRTENIAKMMTSSMIEMKPGTSVFYNGADLNIALIGNEYILVNGVYLGVSVYGGEKEAPHPHDWD